MPRRDGYVATGTRHGRCATCGDDTVTRAGVTTHTVVSRGDAWQGTAAELLHCNPNRVSIPETPVDSETGV